MPAKKAAVKKGSSAEILRSNNMVDVLIAAGIRPPARWEQLIRWGKFMLPFTITDNATTASDLTASLSDIRLARAGSKATGATFTDPACVLVAEKAAFVFVEGVETLTVLAQLVERCILKHQPGGSGEVHEVPFSEHIASLVKAVAQSETTGTAIRVYALDEIECKPIREGAMWMDFENDPVTIEPNVAVNSGANVGGYAIFEGVAFPNNGWLSQANQLCDNRTVVDKLKGLSAELGGIERLFPGKRGLRVVAPLK